MAARLLFEASASCGAALRWTFRKRQHASCKTVPPWVSLVKVLVKAELYRVWIRGSEAVAKGAGRVWNLVSDAHKSDACWLYAIPWITRLKCSACVEQRRAWVSMIAPHRWRALMSSCRTPGTLAASHLPQISAMLTRAPECIVCNIVPGPKSSACSSKRAGSI